MIKKLIQQTALFGLSVFAVYTVHAQSVTYRLSLPAPLAAVEADIQASNGLELSCNDSTILTASGGSTFLWSNSSTEASIKVGEAGTYSVTVAEAGGCWAADSVVVTHDGSAPSDTAIAVIAQDSFLFNQQLYTVSGIYTQTLTGTAGCDSVVTVHLTLADLSDTICNGSNIGYIHLTAPDEYEYLWSNGATTAGITGLAAGTYSVTITLEDLSSSQSFTIVETSPIDVVLSPYGNNCAGESNGAIYAYEQIEGSNYSYLWENGTTNSYLYYLAEGEYFLTVTDTNSCSKTYSEFVVDPDSIRVEFTITNTCAGTGTGVVQAAVSGGTTYDFDGGGYWYYWSTGASDEAMLSGLTAGAYSVYIGDGNSCGGEFYFEIEALDPAQIVSLSDSVIGSTSAELSWITSNSCYDSTTVRYRKLGVTGWKFLHTLDQSLVLSGLTMNTTYEWRADLKKNGASISLSPTQLFTTNCGIPGKAINLTANVTGTAAADISWENPDGCAEEATIRYRKKGASAWIFVTTQNLSYSLTGLSSGTTYEWRVLLTNAAGSSALTASAEFKTTCDLTLYKPTNLISATGPDYCAVSWMANGCPDGAIVRYRPVGTTTWYFSILSAYSNSVTLVNLTPGVQYEWRVLTKLNTGTTSPLSAYGYFTIPSARLAGSTEPMTQTLSAEVFPNPFHDALSVRFQGESGSNYRIELYDLQGKLIGSPVVGNAVDGENMVGCSMTTAPGMYILSVSSGGREERILVTRR